MRYTEQSLPVGVIASAWSSLDVDLLVVPVFEGEVPALPADLEAVVGPLVRAVIERREFTPKPFATLVLPAAGPGWRPERVMLAGFGTRAECDARRVRRAASAAALAARERRVRRLAMAASGALPLADEARAAAEGLTLASHYSGIYKSGDEARPAPIEALVVVPPATASADVREAEREAGRGYILASCSNLARALTNEPANVMTPRLFADIAGQVGSDAGLRVDVLDEDRIAGLGMGLLLGVSRGSAEPPRVVVLRYDPPDAPARPLLGLVGKGVTFDTGGISIKPSDRMHLMKTDMAGGAAVLSAMKAVAALKPNAPVIGVVPLVENMPGGRATRPGDVLRSASGKTVEVLDTDAEGRLILGDALWYARELGATHLLDAATLTGAIGIALGRDMTGLFGTPAQWTDLVARTAARAGDRVWQMPLVDEYREQLRSEIADISNIGGRPAGSITAALFLQEFSGGRPWAHLDIASTAWADEAQPWQPKGPTGVAVRTMAELACTPDAWPPPVA
ncbi:MAG TPA: leucyl aminopeptidase [Vicinamibacterales bacterium]|nr:leucyl aminopeptidase [Vicinamibacterales bacterium]